MSPQEMLSVRAGQAALHQTRTSGHRNASSNYDTRPHVNDDDA